MDERRRGGGTGVNRPPTVQGFGFRNIEQQERFRSLCLLAAGKNGGDWGEAVALSWGELVELWGCARGTVGRMMQVFTDVGLVESAHRGNQKVGSHYLIHRAEEFLGFCEEPAQGGRADGLGGAGQRALLGGEGKNRLQDLHDREDEFYTEDGQLRR